MDTADQGSTPGPRPDPDAAGKPSSLGELTRHSWRYLLRRSLREFGRDECGDLAAGLTYYGVLAVLPGLIALVSLLGLFGQGSQSVDTVLEVARRVVPAESLEFIGPVLQGRTTTGATVGLVLGLLGGLYFVSAYVGAFSRAMNRVYGIAEGRPIWKLQPIMIAVTVVLGLLCFVAVVLLTVSGPLARVVGEVLGLGGTVVTVWNWVKWPVLLAVVVSVVALLYYVTPNVLQPRFRWLSPGALLAIGIWAIGSTLFGLYVSNFSTYDTVYGSMAGVIIFLVWLWVTNIALLLGAELDAEIERARELQAGIEAEHDVQLPPSDTRVIEKASASHDQDVAAGQELRRRHAGSEG